MRILLGPSAAQFYELYAGGQSPIATEALARIQQLYAIETDIRGQPARSGP